MGSLEHGHWSQVEISSHTAWIFEPKIPKETGETVIYLHDLHDTRLDPEGPIASALAARKFRIVCPIAGPSWWVDRLPPDSKASCTPEKLIVEHALDFLNEAYGIAPPQIAICGVGMGGQGALRIAQRFASKFPIVAAIAPIIDFHFTYDAGEPYIRKLYRDMEQARQDTALLHVHPLAWVRHLWMSADPVDYDVWNGADRMRMKLSSMGIPLEFDLETSTDGDLPRYIEQMAEPMAQFIADRFVKDRLRLV